MIMLGRKIESYSSNYQIRVIYSNFIVKSISMEELSITRLFS